MDHLRSHHARLVAVGGLLSALLAPTALAQGSADPATQATRGGVIEPWSSQAPGSPPEDPWDSPLALAYAEAHAAPGGRRVLAAARVMMDEGTVVRGSCFDWVDAVFQRAGGHWQDAFHGPRTGPYAPVSDLQPGDWVLFMNHEFSDDTHSAIFVSWADESQRVAVMTSYAGGRRDEPGRFGTYTLTGVYRIVRMLDEAPDRVRVTHHARRHTPPHEPHGATHRPHRSRRRT